jgi:hypothetical protein
MFRVEPAHPADTVVDAPVAVGARQWAVRVGGAASLLRQRAFKAEALVPVTPTAYAALLLPARPAGGDPARDRDASAAAVASYLSRLLDGAAADCAAHVIAAHALLTVYCGETATVVLIDATGVADGGLEPHEAVFDLLALVEGDAEPYCAAASSLHAVMVPCDGRPLASVGLAEGGGLLGDFYQLPTCPMCFDRLDVTVSGVAGPHTACRCSDRDYTGCRCFDGCAAACAVCRAFTTAPPRMPDCAACGAAEEAWLCLVCGAAGCSRYHGQHAKAHATAAAHDFAISVATQQVWDYAADEFTHRWLMRWDHSAGTAEKMRLPERLGAEQQLAAVAGKLGASPTAAAKTASKTLVDAKLDAKVEQL